jgi:hypothetical protein
MGQDSSIQGALRRLREETEREINAIHRWRSATEDLIEQGLLEVAGERNGRTLWRLTELGFLAADESPLIQ